MSLSSAEGMITHLAALSTSCYYLDMKTPFIDPAVRHVPVSYLRKLNTERLKEERQTLVIDGFDYREPLSVIMPYKTFLKMQDAIKENANG